MENQRNYFFFKNVGNESFLKNKTQVAECIDQFAREEFLHCIDK
jgi:hypothetical protein